MTTIKHIGEGTAIAAIGAAGAAAAVLLAQLAATGVVLVGHILLG